MYSPQNGGLARECKDVKINCVRTGSSIGRKTKNFSAAAQFLTTSVFHFHWNKICLFQATLKDLKTSYLDFTLTYIGNLYIGLIDTPTTPSFRAQQRMMTMYLRLSWHSCVHQLTTSQPFSPIRNSKDPVRSVNLVLYSPKLLSP